MGYEAKMQEEIVALLQLFRSRAPDQETNSWVADLAANRAKWPEAKALFRRIRDRCLAVVDRLHGRSSEAPDDKDPMRARQYTFEELCLKSLYNETATQIPFDPSTPYFVIRFALRLARAIGVSVEDVLAIVAPDD